MEEFSGSMKKNIEVSRIAKEERDEEMETIGYPPPLNPAAFARRLAEIIKKALQKERVSKKES